MSAVVRPRFDGARALVTGGSSGIGLAIARALLERGAHVGLLARDAGRLRDAHEALREHARPGRTIERFSVDVTDYAAVEAACGPITERLGGMDLVVMSAGITHPAALVDTDVATLRRLMDTNYFGTVHVVKTFLPQLLSQRRGHMVGISSLAGVLGVYGYAGYAATKYALRGFFECVRQEVLAAGIGVTLAFPGDTDTPQLAEENRTKPEVTRQIAGTVPVLSPDAVARAIVRGIEQDRFEVYPGAYAKVVATANRHLPGLVRAVVDRDVRRVLGV